MNVGESSETQRELIKGVGIKGSKKEGEKLLIGCPKQEISTSEPAQSVHFRSRREDSVSIVQEMSLNWNSIVHN